MIKGYKIKYLSPHTEIKSYTLFGAFCWGYRFLEGKSALESFLIDFQKEPKFLVSSPFPMFQGKLLFPKPTLLFYGEANISVLDKLKRKPYKKAKWITQSVFEDVINGKTKTQNDLIKNYKVNYSIIHKPTENVKELESKDVIFTHNEINRLNNKSNNLYFENGILSNEEYFLVKFLDSSFRDKFEMVLNIIEDLGFGGNKNIGWGKVRITPLEKDFSFLERNKSDLFITLSSIIPTGNCFLNKSLYNFSTFKSYTEGSFSQATVKNKIIYLKEGSLIKIKDKNSFAGEIKKFNLKKRSNVDFINVFQYGIEFPVYLGWKDD